MKRIATLLSIVLTLLSPSLACAMDKVLFDDLMADIQSKEFEAVEQFLEANKAALPKDPEYSVLLLNYVFSKGDRTGIVVAKGTPKGDDLALRDQETGETVGFIGNRGGYDEKLIVGGITNVQKALTSFNSRLDIHFGIITIAERIERWDIVGHQLNTILESSTTLDNQWTWGPINAMKGVPKEFMLNNITAKCGSLFRAQTRQADKAFEKVSKSLIRLYPDEIYGYANLGTLYLARKKYDLAKEYYSRALKIDPNDEIVLNNLERLKALREKKE